MDRGQVKSIGLSNFNISQCEDVLSNCRIKPVCNQIEVHPYFQNTKLVEFCQNNGILVVGYSAVGAVDIAEAQSEVENVLQDETLIRIGKKYGKTAAQVCLRWSLQRGCVPLVKSLEFDKILENAQV
jgi:diketogulonate reductase-like aldo/keto reductase